MSNSSNKSVLLVMDMQNSIVSRYVDNDKVLSPFQQSIAFARDQGIPVIYVKVAFRAGFPEINPSNKMFGNTRNRAGSMTIPEEMTQIHQSVEPRADEIIVNKLRVSAFTGSDLDVILRSNHIDTLILSGIATSGVILSTLREAADKDYTIKVLSDACIDPDPETHRVLIEKVFPAQAEVVTVDEWIISQSHS
ncbi:Isochorismatase family protein YecD [compost metagenome]